MFVVLVQLLSFQHEELADEAAQARYSDLVVKCLIKVSKTVGHMLTVDEDTDTVVTVRQCILFTCLSPSCTTCTAWVRLSGMPSRYWTCPAS